MLRAKNVCFRNVSNEMSFYKIAKQDFIIKPQFKIYEIILVVF